MEPIKNAPVTPSYSRREEELEKLVEEILANTVYGQTDWGVRAWKVLKGDLS